MSYIQSTDTQQLIYTIVDNIINNVLQTIEPNQKRKTIVEFEVGKKYILDIDTYEIINISKARKRLTYLLNGVTKIKRQIRYNFVKNCEYIYPYDIPLYNALGRNHTAMDRNTLKATQIL